MQIVAVVNRTAGAVAAGQLTLEELREAFARAGVAAEVRLVGGEEIAGAVAAAAASGADAVVAGGGDGTLRCAAGVLAGSGVPLGVLPLGTLNHFARDLGLTADVAAAAAVVAAGNVRAVDLGEVNGEVFLNTSVLGFYPPVVLERDRQRHHLGRGKWLAAAVALWRVGLRSRSLAVRVEVEGAAVRRRTRFVFVGNNEYEMNVFEHGRRERFDDGHLYLYLARGARRSTLLWLALRALVQDVRQTGQFESWSPRDFTIDTHHSRLPVFLDGEVVHLAPPLRYRCRPGALRVLAPAG